MSMFYNKGIQIYVYGEIEDDHEITRVKYTLLIADEPILVDVQPYSSEKAKKDYGYNVVTTKRMFCDIIQGITESTVIKYMDQYYSIQKIVQWDDYLDVMLLEKYDVVVLEGSDIDEKL